ncbi:MAG TPA: hypothetical protein PLS69_00775 [Terricaulis sp.]|nr:hypothetical protein [Terricaulis sp.]
MAKKPNIRTAGIDLAFLLAAHIAGWLNTPTWAMGLLIAAAIGAWWFTRRHALARMDLRTRTYQSAIALAMLAGVLALFYWMGLTFGGHN